MLTSINQSCSGSFLNLFQYMIILFLVFVLQFSVSCACLALNKEQQVGVHVYSLLSNSFFLTKHHASDLFLP